MNEKTLNKFLVGATVEQVMLYPSAALHIRIDNGALLTVNCSLPVMMEVDILGPSQPEVIEMEAK